MKLPGVMLKIIRLAVCVFTAQGIGFSQQNVEVPVNPKLIVDQHIYPDSVNACGPCSLLNLLTFSSDSYRKAKNSLQSEGDAGLHFLIEHYFKERPSIVVRGRQRWGLHGVMSADLVAGLNELLQENEIKPLKASYLDKRAGESDAQFLKRIHGWMRNSVSRGVPPVLSLRSYVVRLQDEKTNQPAWALAEHHYVLLTSLTKKLEPVPPARGFQAVVLDSNGAVQRPVYIHLESNGQAFRALKGVEPGGQWLDGRPFLLVEASQIRSLRPANLKWSERFIVVANFLIGDF